MGMQNNMVTILNNRGTDCPYCRKPINRKEHYKKVYSTNYVCDYKTKSGKIKQRKFKKLLAYDIHSSCMVKMTGVAW
jgi:hypothetical protein